MAIRFNFSIFTESGHFVHIPETWKHRAIEIWQDKVFELLLNGKKIDQETVAGMRTWSHSGFSVDNSVRIEAHDHAAMQRTCRVYCSVLFLTCKNY